jgi:hypothetical protein
MGKTKPKPGRKWILETAPTGRARCRKCDHLIDEGTTRVGVLTENHKYGEYYKYYHPICAEKVKKIGFTLGKQARKEINDAKQRQQRRVSEFLGQVARGEIHLSVTEDGAKMTARKRFGHKDYARLIKQSFTITKDQMRDSSRNGTLTLAISPGWADNEVCSDFYCVLVQHPADGRKVPKITFPPESGDRNNCINTEDHIEVRSMSQMLQKSILGSAQTPAVVFGLIDAVAALDAAECPGGDGGDVTITSGCGTGSGEGSVGPDRMVVDANHDLVAFEDVKTIGRLRDKGLTLREIADRTGISRAQSCLAIKRYDAERERINNLDVSTPEGQQVLRNLCKVGEPGIMNQQDAAFAKAGVSAAINHKETTRCTCPTHGLLCSGCQCGAFEKQKEGKVVSLDTETTGQNDLGITGVAFVPDHAAIDHVGGDAATSLPLPVKTEKGLLTAKEALDAVVSTRYQAAAEKVADAKAHVDIANQCLVPGMKVYHVFRNLPCVLLEETSPGKWTVEDAQGDHHTGCSAATLTPRYPGHIKRFQAEIAAATGRAITALQGNEGLRETIKNVSLYSLLVMIMAALVLYKFGG